MWDWCAGLGAWAAWYQGAATALLLAALATILANRQPSTRLTVARHAIAGLWLLLAASVVPPLWGAVAGLGAGSVAASVRSRSEPRTVSDPSPSREVITPRAAVCETTPTDPAFPPRDFSVLTRPPILRDCPEIVLSTAANGLIDPGCDPTASSLPASADSTAAPSPGAEPDRLPVLGWVGLFWLVGGLATAGWQVGGFLAAHRLLRGAVEPPGSWRSALANLAGGRGRLPRLLVSPNAPGPLAVGLLRPTIVLPGPASDRDREPEGRIAAAIAHEYAHIRRGDLRLLAASRLLTPILASHPAYWLLRRLIRSDQEALADASAVQAAGGDPFSYAEALIDWARPRSGSAGFAAVGLGLGGRSDLPERIARLLDRGRRVEPSCPRRWSIASALATVGLVALLSARGIGSDPAAPVSHQCGDCEHTRRLTVVPAYVCPPEAIEPFRPVVADFRCPTDPATSVPTVTDLDR